MRRVCLVVVALALVVPASRSGADDGRAATGSLSVSPTTVPQNGQATFTWSVTRSDPADTRPIRVLIDRITNSGADVCAGCPDSGSKTITIFHDVGAHEAILLIDNPVTVEVLAKATFTVTEAAPASPSPSPSPTPGGSCPTGFSRECAPPAWTGPCGDKTQVGIGKQASPHFSASAAGGTVTSIVATEKPAFATVHITSSLPAAAAELFVNAAPTAQNAQPQQTYVLTLRATNSDGVSTSCTHLFETLAQTVPVWSGECGTRLPIEHGGVAYATARVDMPPTALEGDRLDRVVRSNGTSISVDVIPTLAADRKSATVDFVAHAPKDETGVGGELTGIAIALTALQEGSGCTVKFDIVACPRKSDLRACTPPPSYTPSAPPSSNPLDVLWAAVCPLVQGFLGLFGIDFACPGESGYSTRLSSPADAVVAFAPMLACNNTVIARALAAPTQIPLVAFASHSSPVTLATSSGGLTLSTKGNPTTGILFLRPTVVDAVLGFGRTSTILATARAGRVDGDVSDRGDQYAPVRGGISVRRCLVALTALVLVVPVSGAQSGESRAASGSLSVSPTSVPQNGNLTFTWSVSGANGRRVVVGIDNVQPGIHGPDVCNGCPESGSKTIPASMAPGEWLGYLYVDNPVTIEILARARFTVTAAALASPSPSPTPSPTLPPTWANPCGGSGLIAFETVRNYRFDVTANGGRQIVSIVATEKPTPVTEFSVSTLPETFGLVSVTVKTFPEFGAQVGTTFALSMKATDSRGDTATCTHQFKVGESVAPEWDRIDCGLTEQLRIGFVHGRHASVVAGVPIEVLLLSKPTYVFVDPPKYADGGTTAVVEWSVRPTSNDLASRSHSIEFLARDQYGHTSSCKNTYVLSECPSRRSTTVDCPAPSSTPPPSVLPPSYTPSAPPSSNPLDVLWGSVCPLIKGFFELFDVDFACPGDPGYSARLSATTDAVVAFAPMLACGTTVSAPALRPPTRVPLAAFTTRSSPVSLSASGHELATTSGNPATGVLTLRPTVVDALMGFGTTSVVVASARAAGSSAMCPIEMVSTLL